MIEFYYKIEDGSIFLGEFGGGEGLCNKHSIPGKEIFPPHTRFPGPNFFPIVFISDNKGSPGRTHKVTQHFWPIYSNFLPIIKRGEAPTFQHLIHSLQSFSKMSQGTGDGGTFLYHKCHVAPSAPLPFPWIPPQNQLPLATNTNPELPTLYIEK